MSRTTEITVSGLTNSYEFLTGNRDLAEYAGMAVGEKREYRGENAETYIRAHYKRGAIKDFDYTIALLMMTAIREQAETTSSHAGDWGRVYDEVFKETYDINLVVRVRYLD